MANIIDAGIFGEDANTPKVDTSTSSPEVDTSSPTSSPLDVASLGINSDMATAASDPSSVDNIRLDTPTYTSLLHRKATVPTLQFRIQDKVREVVDNFHNRNTSGFKPPIRMFDDITEELSAAGGTEEIAKKVFKAGAKQFLKEINANHNSRLEQLQSKDVLTPDDRAEVAEIEGEIKRNQGRMDDIVHDINPKTLPEDLSATEDYAKARQIAGMDNNIYLLAKSYLFGSNDLAEHSKEANKDIVKMLSGLTTKDDKGNTVPKYTSVSIVGSTSSVKNGQRVYNTDNERVTAVDGDTVIVDSTGREIVIDYSFINGLFASKNKIGLSGVGGTLGFMSPVPGGAAAGAILGDVAGEYVDNINNSFRLGTEINTKRALINASESGQDAILMGVIGDGAIRIASPLVQKAIRKYTGDIVEIKAGNLDTLAAFKEENPHLSKRALNDLDLLSQGKSIKTDGWLKKWWYDSPAAERTVAETKGMSEEDISIRAWMESSTQAPQYIDYIEDVYIDAANKFELTNKKFNNYIEKNINTDTFQLGLGKELVEYEDAIKFNFSSIKEDGLNYVDDGYTFDMETHILASLEDILTSHKFDKTPDKVSIEVIHKELRNISDRLTGRTIKKSSDNTALKEPDFSITSQKAAEESKRLTEEVVKLSNSEENLNGLFLARERLNELLRTDSGKANPDLNRLLLSARDRIDSEIDNVAKNFMHEDLGGKWLDQYRSSQDEYFIMSETMRNKFVSAIEATDGTADDVIKVLIDKSKSNEGFIEEVMRQLPAHVGRNAENLIVKNSIVRSDKGYIDFTKTANNFRKLNLKTADNIVYKELVETFSFHFSNNPNLLESLKNVNIEMVEGKYFYVGNITGTLRTIFNVSRSHIPGLEFTKKLKLRNNIDRILKNPTEKKTMDELVALIPDLKEPLHKLGMNYSQYTQFFTEGKAPIYVQNSGKPTSNNLGNGVLYKLGSVSRGSGKKGAKEELIHPKLIVDKREVDKWNVFGDGKPLTNAVYKDKEKFKTIREAIIDRGYFGITEGEDVMMLRVTNNSSPKKKVETDFKVTGSTAKREAIPEPTKPIKPKVSEEQA